MTKISKKTFWKLVVVLLLATTGWIIYKLAWQGSILFSNMENVSSIKVDDKSIWHNAKKIKLKAGKHSIELVGPLIEEFTINVTIGPFGKVEIQGPTELLDASRLATKLSSGDLRGGFNVVREKLLENNTWLVFTLQDPQGKMDSSDYIYNFTEGVWVRVEYGTGLNYYTLRDLALPRSVMEHFDTR